MPLRCTSLTGQHCAPVRMPEEAPEDAVQLMEDCLLEDPAARPRAKQIVERLQRMVHRSSREVHQPQFR